MNVTLTVNGEALSLDVPPSTTLLDLLRDRLGLHGTKEYCHSGVCGACTVLADGKAVSSCSMLAGQVEGADVLTIEGLTPDEGLHPIQQAFVDNDAQQCGFCTPGFIVASAALLNRHPNPDQDTVHRELGGNLCRCGTYAGVRAAVAQAAGGGTTNG